MPKLDRWEQRLPSPLNIVVLGLSITSSWGNGHATTYRALLRQFAQRGHQVTFLERDVPWYASQRDMPKPDFCETLLYSSLDELQRNHADLVRHADAVIVGSYVPEGVPVGEWVTQIARGATAFYDIDTPVTLAKLAAGDYEYLSPELIARYDLYLSFAGGPTLDTLQDKYGSPMARALYCSVDPELYYSEPQRECEWDLGYMGTYSDDRQPPLESLMLDASRKWDGGVFVVAGPQYPPSVRWPSNCCHIEHLPPSEHRAFYNSQRYTLNITRADMIRAGWSPSVRLFEAAACGVPIISDYWNGLESVFEIGAEILISRSADETLRYLKEYSEEQRQQIGHAARERVLLQHTSAHRAAELESYLNQAIGGKSESIYAEEKPDYSELANL